MTVSTPLIIGGTEIAPGTETTLHLTVPAFSADLPAQMPVRVIRAAEPGPRLFITSCIHGDEVIGIEIIGRLLDSGRLKNLVRGDVILVPVVNVFGFVIQSRYLPDRRDLNRSFPGGEHGSLAARLAHILMREIVDQCSHGIDLHSGAAHHFNLPQIRIEAESEETLALARAFAPPIILKTGLLEGSLRQMARDRRMPVLLFEGSEAGRFDEQAGEAGCAGILRVLTALGMLEDTNAPPAPSIIADQSSWIRAHSSGILNAAVKPGERIRPGQTIGRILNFFGETVGQVEASCGGIVIGQSLMPVVNEGDALFHIATPVEGGDG